MLQVVLSTCKMQYANELSCLFYLLSFGRSSLMICAIFLQKHYPKIRYSIFYRYNFINIAFSMKSKVIIFIYDSTHNIYFVSLSNILVSQVKLTFHYSNYIQSRMMPMTWKAARIWLPKQVNCNVIIPYLLYEIQSTFNDHKRLNIMTQTLLCVMLTYGHEF